MDDEHLDKVVQAIAEKEAHTVFEYASTIVTIAKYIQRKSIRMDTPSLVSIRVGGERLEQTDRELIENTFYVPIYRRYSDMELGIVGQDMAYGNAYELNWGSLYFELLKLDSDEPAMPDEVGRIVITDLFNYAQPMIRYDTGDIGIMEYPETGRPRLKEI